MSTRQQNKQHPNNSWLIDVASSCWAKLILCGCFPHKAQNHIRIETDIEQKVQTQTKKAKQLQWH